MTPQQEQQRQQDAPNEWEREDAIRKTTMETLLLFLWTNRHALAALIIKTLEAKLKEEEPPFPDFKAWPWKDKVAGSADLPTVPPETPPEIARQFTQAANDPVTLTSEELTQRGPMVSVTGDVAKLLSEAPVSNPVIPTTGIGPIIEPWKPTTACETTDGPGGENMPTVHDTASAILEAKK